MIRYALACENRHSFESWFRDSSAYEALETSGQLACPACASTKVRKALMAPSVVTSRRKRDRSAGEPDGTPAASASVPSPAAPQPTALLDERERHLRYMARQLHREITAKADHVGRAFAAEARRIHEGDAPPRSIYGEASLDEVEALIDDGIPLLPMPVLPDDHH